MADVYAKPLGIIRVGIERWTEAVFGTKFNSKGKVLGVGQQNDAHSCGVCVINFIYCAMHGDKLFTWVDCSLHRLQYFINAVEHLFGGKVCSLPIWHGLICSSLLVQD